MTSIEPRRFARALAVAALMSPVPAFADDGGHSFQRIATFPTFLNTSVEAETVAEIITSSEDGNTLIYTDSATESIGFIDITDAANPRPLGEIPVDGEPTSVGHAGRYALAAVNTSDSFTNPSGALKVIDIDGRQVVREIVLDGQPDSIAVSPDQRFAIIAIENKRDESVVVDGVVGGLPQAPAGFLVIVDLIGEPANWSIREVSLDGVPDLFPTDAEPEYVDINKRNIAVATLQENNHIVLVDLPSGGIVRDFSARTVDLSDVDVEENDLIELNGTLLDVPREPDSVTWVSNRRFATADEGDFEGGSRGFTVFNRKGRIKFAPGNRVEHTAVRIGHYPEDRSENKGNEPEGIDFGNYSKGRFLFVGSERGSFILVYRLKSSGKVRELVQVLPTGKAPEGLLAIPGRDLLVVAAEADDRDAGFRSTVTIYQLRKGKPTYPTIRSDDRPYGTPIPWGALSGLAGDRNESDRLYAVHDSFYKQSRIYTLDIDHKPAVITDELVLSDGGTTVDLDLKGVAQRAGGGFWVVSDGDDLLIQVAADGSITGTTALPASSGAQGVAVTGRGSEERVYIAFENGLIGQFEPAVGGALSFYSYPLDAATSPNGGTVGLSGLVAVDDTTLAVIERDDQGGTDATIKKIYSFSVAGLDPQPEGGSLPVVAKTLVRDLIPDLTADNGPVLEKVDGLAIAANGQVLIVTDNDGLDDATGETQFLNLGRIFRDRDGDPDEDD